MFREYSISLITTHTCTQIQGLLVSVSKKTDMNRSLTGYEGLIWFIGISLLVYKGNKFVSCKYIVL